VSFSEFVFRKSVIFLLFLLRFSEHQPQTFATVITPLKLGRLGKSAIENQSKRLYTMFTKIFLRNLNISVI
jgi:hypothetical protein